MIAVYKKELRSYLKSMTGYVFIAFLLALIGVYYSFINLNLSSPRFEFVLNNVQFVFIVFVPLLTMRVMAEERGQRTDQLLLTLPLTITEIVIGKFLALVTVFALPMFIICIYPFILATAGRINYAAAYLSILGFFLLGTANIAIGEFLSSLTENSVIAAVMTFGVLLVCYLMNSLSGMIPNTAIASYLCLAVTIILLAIVIYNMIHSIIVTGLIAVILEALLGIAFLTQRTIFEGFVPSLLGQFYMNGRLTSFFDGILDLRAIVYYVSIIAVALLLTVQTIAKRRWN